VENLAEKDWLILAAGLLIGIPVGIALLWFFTHSKSTVAKTYANLGDVIEVRLWATATTVNWDYDAFQIQPSRVVTTEALNSPCYTNFKNVIACPTLVKGNPYASGTGYIYACHLDYSLISFSYPTAFDLLFPRATYCLYRLYYGDYSSMNAAVAATSSSYRPYYYKNVVPLGISLVIWKFW
jgi:hypothetical protein